MLILGLVIAKLGGLLLAGSSDTVLLCDVSIESDYGSLLFLDSRLHYSWVLDFLRISLNNRIELLGVHGLIKVLFVFLYLILSWCESINELLSGISSGGQFGVLFDNSELALSDFIV